MAKKISGNGKQTTARCHVGARLRAIDFKYIARKRAPTGEATAGNQ